MRKLLPIVFAFAGVPVLADPVVPGGVLQNDLNSYALGPAFTNGDLTSVTSYTQLVASMTNPIGGLAHHYTGSVTSSVYRDAATGYLAFEYSFDITGHTGGGLFSAAESATIGGDWSDYDILDAGSSRAGDAGAGVSTASAGLGGAGWTDGSPFTLGRNSLADGAAPRAFFNLPYFAGTEFFAGQGSANFWFTTNARAFGMDDMVIRDGGLEGEAPVFVAVPAPGALVLGLIGMGGIGSLRRRLA